MITARDENARSHGLRRRGILLTAAFVAVAAFATVGEGQVVRAATQPTLAPVLGASTWLNGRPSRDALRGKVVLVDVFTVDCINCRNVTPNLRHLSQTLHGKLAIIGVHTPELPVERERSHVVASLRELGITWPVAIDDDSALWNAYGVDAWPTEMLFDRKGHLRKTIVGDSQDDELDAAVNELLAEKS